MKKRAILKKLKNMSFILESFFSKQVQKFPVLDPICEVNKFGIGNCCKNHSDLMLQVT